MSIRVLIVEDNDVARSFLARVVRESFSDDIVFTEARGLDAARQALGVDDRRRVHPDPKGYRLILCDLEQPDGSGLELLAQLADYPAIKIATTLHSDDDHLFPALQCGADGYLLKEDRYEVLVEELQKIVRGQPSLSPAIARRFLGFFRGIDHHRNGGNGGSGDSTFGGLSDFGSRTLPAPLGSPAGDMPGLNGREHEVLTHLAKGFTIKEIARLMGIKWFAVNDHIRSVYRKLAQHSSPDDAVEHARQSRA
ncbi:MAG TPA: response regulator transcription factor [Burkholderiaceae bacterium]|nr:response regulator transcription factor [Burkholderiaceae bacterium]HMX12208.1 response regulator transcription factor [Burkholderiaceae bacterium]HMY98223.1 response regulator transcription factor [Burkholderiaceae bacterium]HNB45733.1 response regulator transcription factor [Burkholderiaceae bacterium]HNG80619.1 response regulator transcription factor [Burkholderiaceae bacterium]